MSRAQSLLLARPTLGLWLARKDELDASGRRGALQCGLCRGAVDELRCRQLTVGQRLVAALQRERQHRALPTEQLPRAASADCTSGRSSPDRSLFAVAIGAVSATLTGLRRRVPRPPLHSAARDLLMPN
jgi:hypothetical protein